MLDDDLFEGEGITDSKKSKPKKTKKAAMSKKAADAAVDEGKSTAATIVTVNMMGIGNKPFLRGNGAGLSWEKGVEMEFQEIGKWIWSVPENWNESVEIQVYRNDENADRKGKYTLKPGQQLELTPES